MKKSILIFLAILSFGSLSAQKSELFSVIFLQGSAVISPEDQRGLKMEMAEHDLSKLKLELMPPIAYGVDAQLSKPRAEAVKALLLGLGMVADSVVILPASTNPPFWRDLQAQLDRRVMINGDVPKKYDLMKNWVVYAPQIFNANGATSITVTGKDGTRIEFPAGIFVDEGGRPVTTDIRIELIEFLKISDMILNNLTTWSGRKILETGGMAHITAWRGNEMLSLAPGASYTITFPERDNGGPMSTFYGAGHDHVDWTQGEAGQGVGQNVEDEKSIEGAYLSLKVSRLMWINCDRFNDPDQTAPLAVKLTGGDKLHVFAILTSSRSVLSADYNGSFWKLPKNEKVFIVATSADKTKMYYGKSEVIPGKDAVATVEVKAVTKAELDSQLAQLDKSFP